MNNLRRISSTICIILLAPWTLYFANAYMASARETQAHHYHFYNVFANLNTAMASLGLINLWFVGFVTLALLALLLRPEQ